MTAALDAHLRRLHLANTHRIWPSLCDRGEAQGYCTTLDLAGTGWRLPSYKELLSIVDRAASNPAYDTSLFPLASTVTFWSVGSGCRRFSARTSVPGRDRSTRKEEGASHRRRPPWRRQSNEDHRPGRPRRPR